MSTAVNLYSDTQTQPTDGMRRAMADGGGAADEQRGLDPTVNALQDGSPSCSARRQDCFCPPGPMCNEISIRLHIRPGGDECYLHRTAHPIVAEAGGPAALSGAMMRTLEGAAGMFTRRQLRAAMRVARRPLRAALAPRVGRADDELRRRAGLAARRRSTRCSASRARTASHATSTAPG